MAAIELEGIEKSYGSIEVLKGVTFSVEKGEIYGVLGPNGAGKTTTFRIILGLLRQDSGSIAVDGDKHQNSKEIRRKIGYLPADVNFYEDMTARQNLRYFSDLADTDPDFEELLELAGISEDADRNVSGFSTGMKKRLGIAQSLVKDPEIIIYDEPTTGLDPEGKRKFRKHVEKINREKGKTVLVSSHITSEIEPLCDRFGILHEGVIKASGTHEELSEGSNETTGVKIQVKNLRKAEEALGESPEEIEDETKIRDGSVILENPDHREQLLQQLLETEAGIKSVEPRKETLEKAYLRITGDA